MTSRRAFLGASAAVCLLLAGCAAPVRSADPLPSWNDGLARQSIVAFVAKVTQEGTAGYVPPAERIAVFDNDGCLWSEQPVYVQLAFALDRVKALAPQHPEWQTQEPFASLLKGDVAGALAGGEKAIAEIVMATHAGTTNEEFAAIVQDWLATARHPATGRPYTGMVYQPMLELLDYLRANGFKTFIVSGGGMDFMRPWAPAAYGIPPEQIVGSSGVTEFRLNKDGKGELFKTAKVDFIDDGPGKPVGINRNIGRRPIIAFGNSDGDLQMLQYTTSGAGARLGVYVHHDDAVREYAYDRQSQIGKLDKGLDEAPKWGWPVISMKNDWKVIFPAPK